MNKLNNVSEIWDLYPTRSDIEDGVNYAIISWPYTFDRMNLSSTGYKGQRDRILNIVKGITNQNALRRKLSKEGIDVLLHNKSYRDEDLFDFKIKMNEEVHLWDVKTIHHYACYDSNNKRKELSKSLILENKAYDGSDWRTFFPEMVAHTQIQQEKGGYIFGISSSDADFRKNKDSKREKDFIVAIPWGEWADFSSNRKLIYAREKEKEGFDISIVWKGQLPLDDNELKLIIIGENEGKRIEKEISLPKNNPKKEGSFSSITAIHLLERKVLTGRIEIQFNNKFKNPVYNSQMRNINKVPTSPLVIEDEHFVNIFLPNDYHILYLGWIKRDEFLIEYKKYRPWVWPKDSVDKYKNQPWSQITEKDQNLFEKLKLDWKKGLIGGLLKTTGRGNGANCYIFPNQFGGGIKETNLYVLPQDLSIMADFNGL
jgi:hypothetical protein